MPKLPVLSGNELIKILERQRFQIVRQKGSHVSLRKDEFKIVVPLHSRPIKRNIAWYSKAMRSD